MHDFLVEIDAPGNLTISVSANGEPLKSDCVIPVVVQDDQANGSRDD